MPNEAGSRFQVSRSDLAGAFLVSARVSGIALSSILLAHEQTFSVAARALDVCSAGRATLGVAADAGNGALAVSAITELFRPLQHSEPTWTTTNFYVDSSLFRNYFTRHLLPGVSLATS